MVFSEQVAVCMYLLFMKTKFTYLSLLSSFCLEKIQPIAQKRTLFDCLLARNSDTFGMINMEDSRNFKVSTLPIHTTSIRAKGYPCFSSVKGKL